MYCAMVEPQQDDNSHTYIGWREMELLANGGGGGGRASSNLYAKLVYQPTFIHHAELDSYGNFYRLFCEKFYFLADLLSEFDWG